MNLVKRFANRFFEGAVDAVFAPEKRILVLHPFVIAHRYPAGIRQDVGNQKRAVVFEHAIRRWSGRAVGQLSNDSCLHSADVRGSDAVFQSGWTEDVTIDFKHIIGSNLFRTAQAMQRAGAFLVLECCGHIQTAFRIDSTL